MQAEQAEWDSPSPESPGPIQVAALPPGFEEAMACLQGGPSPVTISEVPLEHLELEVMDEPAVATMCTSCIVQNKASGVTYMKTCHHFCGLSGPWVCLPSVAHTPRLTIEDITDLP